MFNTIFHIAGSVKVIILFNWYTFIFNLLIYKVKVLFNFSTRMTLITIFRSKARPTSSITSLASGSIPELLKSTGRLSIFVNWHTFINIIFSKSFHTITSRSFLSSDYYSVYSTILTSFSRSSANFTLCVFTCGTGSSIKVFSI